MTKEEAKATYRRLLDEIGCYDAIRNSPEFYDIVRVAIEHLMESPQNAWAKTVDRLPTLEDSEYNGEIMAIYRSNKIQVMVRDRWDFVANHPEHFPYWMMIPPLPEVTE